MQIIITMAGLGKRFKEAGYTCPKYMIEVNGKTLFELSMDSLLDYNRYVSKYIFVVRKEDCAGEFINNKCIQYGIKEIKIVELGQVTDGQATTCLYALPYCNPEESILVYNIDTYVESYTLKYLDIHGDGHIPCFHADGSHWSFVKLNIDGDVVEVREKQRISDNCTLGAYYFSSAKLYEQIYHEYYSDNRAVEKNEKYIAPMYNYMIQNGLEVTISIIDANKVHVLGTPEELNAYKRDIK